MEKKADSHNIVKSFRPISITSCLCKLNEKFNTNQTHKIRKSKQNTNWYSIRIQTPPTNKRQHLLLNSESSGDIQSKKQMESFGNTVWHCLASAYDKVWHKGLIYKLLKLNIPKYLVAWIREFLKDRKFEVKVNQCISSRQSFKCGVPQGAVLNPLLFSLFINDIPDNTKKNKSYSLLFADDLIYFEIHYRDSILNKNINDQLIRIQEWLEETPYDSTQMQLHNLPQQQTITKRFEPNHEQSIHSKSIGNYFFGHHTRWKTQI